MRAAGTSMAVGVGKVVTEEWQAQANFLNWPPSAASACRGAHADAARSRRPRTGTGGSLRPAPLCTLVPAAGQAGEQLGTLEPGLCCGRIRFADAYKQTLPRACRPGGHRCAQHAALRRTDEALTRKMAELSVGRADPAQFAAEVSPAPPGWQRPQPCTAPGAPWGRLLRFLRELLGPPARLGWSSLMWRTRACRLACSWR